MKKYFVVATLLWINYCSIAAQNSQMLSLTIPAPSLENNMLDIPATQSLLIYLPPSYNVDSEKSYPVVYYLLGYTTRTTELFYFKQLVDRQISKGAIKELIVVIVEGYNFMGGNFYVNSPVTGNCEDLIIKDVIDYIDNNYRTIKNRESRGIAGISMGGFGALNIAMKHPDIFAAVYSLSPGLFDKSGLSNCQLFKSEIFINQFIQKEQEYSTMSNEDALAAFRTYIRGRFNAGDYDTPFTYAYSFAFSSNPNKHFPFFDYPYSKIENKFTVDSLILHNYELGFGGLDSEVVSYKNNLLQLKAIGIDYGIYDEFKWIPAGCRYFSELLTTHGIHHVVNTFNGGHTNMLATREEYYMLPFFSNNLTFLKTSVEWYNCHSSGYYFQVYPNPAINQVIFSYSLTKKVKVQIEIYNAEGKKIAAFNEGIKSVGTYETNLDIHEFPCGTYWAVLQIYQLYEKNINQKLFPITHKLVITK